MVLGKLPVPGHPTIQMIVGQGPIALAVGAGGGCLDISTLLHLFSFSLFSLSSIFSLSPSLWEMARYRLKYCLKGLLNPKQPTNQPECNMAYHQYASECLPVCKHYRLSQLVNIMVCDQTIYTMKLLTTMQTLLFINKSQQNGLPPVCKTRLPTLIMGCHQYVKWFSASM